MTKEGGNVGEAVEEEESDDLGVRGVHDIP